jgi:hypothetical protein
MYSIVTYTGVNEFNLTQSEMTERGLNLRSIDYGSDRISALWETHPGALNDDGTQANCWPRTKFIIGTYLDAEEFNNNQMQGFGVRDVHHAPNGIVVLWYTSLYPAENMETDAAQFRERWRNSPRFRESPICLHNTGQARRRRYYLSDTGMDYLCAICGESFAWKEAEL